LPSGGSAATVTSVTEVSRLLRALEGVGPTGGRLVRLPADRRVVFVGDTHGDADASARVLASYPRPGSVVVFLGDAVDRGPDSVGNLALILEAKRASPDGVHLLMGNHEGWAMAPFRPADFWASLASDAAATVAARLCDLPLAAWHPSGVLALHGALPELSRIEEIDRISLGSADWRRVTWGDWSEADVGGTSGDLLGRPCFGREVFDRIARRLGIRVLVRSHQPDAPTLLFDDRCLTLFTSCAYGGTRRVAILEPGRAPRSARDLLLVEL